MNSNRGATSGYILFAQVCLSEYLQKNLNDSNIDGSFIMANSNSFFEYLGNSLDSSGKQIFMGILGNSLILS